MRARSSSVKTVVIFKPPAVLRARRRRASGESRSLARIVQRKLVDRVEPRRTERNGLKQRVDDFIAKRHIPDRLRIIVLDPEKAQHAEQNQEGRAGQDDLAVQPQSAKAVRMAHIDDDAEPQAPATIKNINTNRM
jgi:hypothetical protein